MNPVNELSLSLKHLKTAIGAVGYWPSYWNKLLGCCVSIIQACFDLHYVLGREPDPLELKELNDLFENPDLSSLIDESAS